MTNVKYISVIARVVAVHLLLLIIFSGCKKFIEVDAPYTTLSQGNVYTSDAVAISAVTSMYTQLGIADRSFQVRVTSVSYITGLSADELTLTNGVSGILAGYYKNNLAATTPPLFWGHFYENVYRANSAIEGLRTSTSLSETVNQHLLGEALFMRAFCYFYLVNLYGDVPLILETDYKNNSLRTRTAASQVWQQLISDLLEAKSLLSSDFVGANLILGTASTERIRPNKYTATALLARAYLYTGDYAKAETQATEIINNKTQFDLVTLMNAFQKDPTVNKEAIWQIQSVTTGWNTNDARVFILPATGPNSSTNPAYLSKRFLNSFELNDNRRSVWVKGMKAGVDSFYYAYKYRSATLNAPVTEYNTVFRLAEQYLIRAEARAQQDNTDGAQTDLNKIRDRAGLPNTTAKTKADLLNAIINERRFELFVEWGHRWFDLKRTNRVDNVMNIETPLKGGTWETTDKYYPVSLDELSANPNLSQTEGY